MLRRIIPVVCLLIVAIAGCGAKPATTAAPAHAVKGQVKLDGKPMPDGEIVFAIPGNVPQILAIKEGAYSGSAHVGKARVEIRAYKAAEPVLMDGKVVNEGSKENYLPDTFNTNSTLTAEVTAGGANEFNFEVTSK